MADELVSAIKEFFKAVEVKENYPNYTITTSDNKKYLLQLVSMDNATLQSEGDEVGLLYEIEHKQFVINNTLMNIETIGAMVNTYYIKSIGGSWTYTVQKADVQWIYRQVWIAKFKP